jgi:hypothetical protein
VLEFRHLNLVEYYCLDSLFLLFSLPLLLAYLAVRLCCRTGKQKTD